MTSTGTDDPILAKCQAQLGLFAKIPVELRLKIWENLFVKIHSFEMFFNKPAVNILSILRCSPYLYNEISNHLYEYLVLGITIWPDYCKKRWISIRATCRWLDVEWNVKDKKRAQRILSDFPFYKTRGQTISVQILSASYDRPAECEMIRLCRTIDGFVDTLTALRHPPHVSVALIGVWTLRGKPIRNIYWTKRYIPDHDAVILPFTRLPRWDYSMPTDLHAIILKEPDHKQHSLLYRFKDDGPSRVNGSSRISEVDAKDVNELQIITRIMVDDMLDKAGGRTANLLRLERFQDWFREGKSWESAYQEKFITGLRSNPQAVMDHDYRLQATRERYMTLISLHHAAHTKLKFGKGVAQNWTSQSLIFTRWDPGVFSKVWPNGIPRYFGAAPPWMEGGFSHILSLYTKRCTKQGEFWKELHWWAYRSYLILYEPGSTIMEDGDDYVRMMKVSTTEE